MKNTSHDARGVVNRAQSCRDGHRHLKRQEQKIGKLKDLLVNQKSTEKAAGSQSCLSSGSTWGGSACGGSVIEVAPFNHTFVIQHHAIPSGLPSPNSQNCSSAQSNHMTACSLNSFNPHLKNQGLKVRGKGRRISDEFIFKYPSKVNKFHLPDRELKPLLSSITYFAP